MPLIAKIYFKAAMCSACTFLKRKGSPVQHEKRWQRTKNRVLINKMVKQHGFQLFLAIFLYSKKQNGK
jgi:hypothetical protein